MREKAPANQSTLEMATPKPRNGVLTICSVAYQSKEMLDLNHELTRRLNPALGDTRWVVVENTSVEEPERLSKGDHRFDVLPGVKRPQLDDGQASLQHGKALNRAVKTVSSRFALLIDPDFFIIRPNWIADVLAHMERRRLAFLGAPWHPRWYRKWRYFPCTHCLFIDLSRIPVAELDFRPDMKQQAGPYFSTFHAELEWMFTRGEKLKALRRMFAHPWTTLEEDRRRRMIIGSTRDTGIVLYQRFSTRPGIRNETFVPVYLPFRDRLIPPPDVRPDTRSPLREALERLRPDWLSFIPKRRGYFSPKKFSAFGLPDLHAQGWEEFLWSGRPFGFHVRKTLRQRENSSVRLEQIQEVLTQVRKAGP